MRMYVGLLFWVFRLGGNLSIASWHGSLLLAVIASCLFGGQPSPQSIKLSYMSHTGSSNKWVCVCVCNVDQTCLVWSEVELKWTSWPTWFHLCLCVCIVQIVSCSSNWNLRTRSVFAGSWRKVSTRAASKGGNVHWQQSCEIVFHATFMAF